MPFGVRRPEWTQGFVARPERFKHFHIGWIRCAGGVEGLNARTINVLIVQRLKLNIPPGDVRITLIADVFAR